jgi:hypothetical protein
MAYCSDCGHSDGIKFFYNRCRYIPCFLFQKIKNKKQKTKNKNKYYNKYR